MLVGSQNKGEKQREYLLTCGFKDSEIRLQVQDEKLTSFIYLLTSTFYPIKTRIK